MDNEKNIAVYRPYKRHCSQSSGEPYPLEPHRNVGFFSFSDMLERAMDWALIIARVTMYLCILLKPTKHFPLYQHFGLQIHGDSMESRMLPS